MNSLVTPKCPNCGAPLQLLADRTCSWCHSPVEVATGSSAATGDTEAELYDAEAQAFQTVARTWTLRPEGPDIVWSAGVSSPGTASRRLLDSLQIGVLQPAAQELAEDPDLDREFCSVVVDAMTLTREGPVCDVLDALINSPGTDPAWAERAREDVKQVRKLIADRHKMDARLHVPETDETAPPHLDAWIAEKLQAAPPAKHHHHW